MRKLKTLLAGFAVAVAMITAVSPAQASPGGAGAKKTTILAAADAPFYVTGYDFAAPLQITASQFVPSDMLLASELRIGNYVEVTMERFKRYPGKNIIRVDSISSDRINGPDNPISLKAIGGLRLDREQLINLGFTWRENWLEKDLLNARITLAFAGGAYDKMTLFQKQPPYDNPVIVEINFGGNHPDTVHKLQNLWHSLTADDELTLANI